MSPYGYIQEIGSDVSTIHSYLHSILYIAAGVTVTVRHQDVVHRVVPIKPENAAARYALCSGQDRDDGLKLGFNNTMRLRVERGGIK